MQPRYQSGDKIGDRYEVRSAARSTLSETYTCLDHKDNILRTLETLAEPDDPKARLTFDNAVAVWVSLGVHPHVVRCYRMEIHNGQPFMILEYIGGEKNAESPIPTLRNRLSKGALKPQRALEFAIHLCRGLKYAGATLPGFVHRNLTPDHVLIAATDSGDVAKISGFELSEIPPDISAPTDAILDSGVFRLEMAGTPAYMAPEQWRGEPLDSRADIYAIGCLLYEMLTGQPAFSGTAEELRNHHLSSPPPTLSDDLPAELNEVVLRCLNKSKDERFESVPALRKAVTVIYRELTGKKPAKIRIVRELPAVDRYDRAVTYNLLRRYDRALADMDHIIQVEPDRAADYTQRAIAYHGLKRYREALADCKSALQLDPADAQAVYYTGRILSSRGELQAAMPYLQQAAQLGITEATEAMVQAAQSMETRKTETLQMSTGVRVALQRAAAEAVRSHHEFIQPEHLFNGITKLEDLITPEALRGLNLPSNITPAFTGEVQRLLELFGRFGIAPRQARRAMRILIGNGGYQRAAGTPGKDAEHISRSPESRAAFDRAPQIAHDAKAPLVGAQHLLAALLDTTDNRVRELLASLGVDVDALYLAAVTLPVTPLDGAYTPTLNQWGTDMTQLALEGKLPETIGRQEEMLQVIRTLARESKNNPVLIGDAGVGKTAIVEGIAYRISRGEIDPNFHNKRIIQISVADLVASTEYRGQFEERMQTMIAEAEAPNIILFIDEIHMLVGAGLVEHSNMDAANILKPALARGQIKLIGATTEAEYYRYIAKDPAFERRMQPLKVLEPTPEATRTILFGIRDRLQKHHGVTIRDDAIDGAIQLSVRYMPSRRLPDKARDLLDEACTRVRYVNIGSARGAALDDTANTDQPADDPGQHVGTVTTETIREVIAEKVGVPVARMSEDETHRILQMPQFLRERVVGQDRAGEGVAAAIRRNYADLRSGKRPVGVFLFVGPSGVGKTELAKATANFLFGSDERMIRLDMSEYMEAHSVSRLIGSPPGYTGFEQGGQLTEALRRTPYAVVLLDEVEKAHPDVMNVFLQSFGEGRLTDGQGRTVDASNVIFMMTSNLGTYAPTALGFRPSDSTEAAQASVENAVQTAVRRHFRPELINRLDEIVVFQSLSQEHMVDIARVHLRPLRDSLAPRNISLEVSDEAVAWLARRGHDVQFGARPLIRLIDKQITNEIGGLLLSGRIDPGSTVHVTVEADELKISTRATDDVTV